MTYDTDDDWVETTLPDGSRTPIALLRGVPDKPLVVIWPGFGMGARYYRPMANELNSRGFTVATGELRGQGRSTARADRRHSWGYRDLATVDYPAVIRSAKTAAGLEPEHPTYLLCHSLGGQVGVIFLALGDAASLGVRGVFGVGAGSPFARSFPRPMARRIIVGTRLFTWASRIYGCWPGSIAGFDPVGYGRQPARLMREWARLARGNEVTGIARGIEGKLARVEIPVLLARFKNDEMCPKASSGALASLVPNARAEVTELGGELGHNRWAREPQVVADRFERFIARVEATG